VLSFCAPAPVAIVSTIADCTAAQQRQNALVGRRQRFVITA
jgi:hypothetical protein